MTQEFERRVVEDWEYRDLVLMLLKPPCGHKFNSRQKERATLWRGAADVVRLLRQTGGRLNEVVRIELAQFYWSKGYVTLHATKTENERNIPLWGSIHEIVQARIREGLTDDTLLFPRAKLATYDNAIARACRKAAKFAKLACGQANGFTCHSFRHTFITDLMEKPGNCAGTVMKYSGHKTLESFSVYLRPTSQGCILATQAMENVDGILTASRNVENVGNAENAKSQTVKPLKSKQIAV